MTLIQNEDTTKQFHARDKLPLYYRYWSSHQDSSCVLYLHGLESHMGWFSAMAYFLNRAGYNVYAFDRRGSGLNKHQRGHIYSYNYLFDDIKVFLDLIKKEHPKSDVFLMGLCLGGKIAANFFLFHPDYVNGLILISPSIENKLALGLRTRLDIAWSAVFNPEKMFAVPIEDEMFTTNRAYLDFIKNDPLRLRHISARYFLELIRMDIDLSRVSHMIRVPLLVLLAGTDEIIDTEGAQRWYDRVISEDKTIKVYKEFRHMLLFEEKGHEVMQCVADWLRARGR